MLKLYHTPLSFNSRRVWITLLEKGLEFELVEIYLDGDQFTPEFLALNPFHHIPVLVEDGFRVLESLAILDYLEAKYPTPALLPQEATALAIARMALMVTVNELVPAMGPLLRPLMALPPVDPQKQQESKDKISTVLNFLEELLGDRPYFGSQHLTQADIVAGCVIPWLPTLGISLDSYAKLQSWAAGLEQRPSWQTTQATPEALEAFKTRMQARMAQQSGG